MSNLTLYFAHWGILLKLHDVSYLLSVNLPSKISPLPSPIIEVTLYHVPLRTSVYEFLGIINLISSATIFTSAHIAILQLSSFFFYRSSYCNFCYCFSLALLITCCHLVSISMLGQLSRFLWPRICADFLNLRIFQWFSLSMISSWSHRGPKRCDKHGYKNEDNSPKNVNNVNK